MVILRTRNKITDFFMILAWASPFNLHFNFFTPAISWRKTAATSGNFVQNGTSRQLKLLATLSKTAELVGDVRP